MMTRISKLTLMFACIALLLFNACGPKKKLVRHKTYPARIVIEPIEPKSIERFSIAKQTPRYSSLQKINTKSDNYELAFQELEEMLVGIKKPDFERAVFISENPFHSNRYTYQSFQKCIDVHLYSIQALISANDKSDSMDFNVRVKEHSRFRMDDIRYLPEERNELYRNALTNWAIFKYMTDTTFVYPFYHLPFTYATHDPFGMKDWSSSQVIGLLTNEENKGNCFSLTALYKILADRLNAGARLCTAPQHIYIQHQDPKGDYYNVELATAGHPTDGTIKTLTYTTGDAIRSGISLRSYTEKQNIGLCLVNLAKSYEHTFNTKGHVFMLRCAELALKYDSLNLNALLLKQQVLDNWVTQYATHHNVNDVSVLREDKKIAKTVLDLENHIALLYRLGYRQMPTEMQEIIMTGKYPNQQVNRNPSPFTTIDPKDPHRKEFQTLYGGLFTEVFRQKESEVFGHFVFSTGNKTLIRIDTSIKENMLIDPVAFAYDFGARIYDPRLGRWLSTDPLQAKYASLSPYNFAGNSPVVFVDRDGRDYGLYIDHKTKTIVIKATYYVIEKDREAAQNAANHWNDQNGKFVYEVDDGNGGKLQYAVSFQLTVAPSSPNLIAAQGNAYDDPEGNHFREVIGDDNMWESGLNDRGQTIEQKYIAVNSTIARPETGAHELGHTLGAEHALVGLMKDGASRAIGETQITEINIAQILNQVGLAMGDRQRVLLETTEKEPLSGTQEKGNFRISSVLGSEPASFKTGTVRQIK